MLLPKRKQCTKCGRKLPATTEFFSRNKGGRYGLRAYCKECQKKYDKKYRENNGDKIVEKQKEYYENNRDEIRQKQKEYRKTHKDEIKEYNKKYRKTHKDEIKEKKKQYYEDNKDEILEKNKQYYEDNKNEILEKCKQYKENNPDKVFNYHNKRRQLEEQQGNGISKEQWLEMMNFFDFKCTYSGIQLNKDNRTIDHIIPLNKGGLNEIWNMCPMYKPYNSSKQDKDMLEWYKQQEFYSEERLNEIYEWCEYAYNKWGKEAM